MPTVCFGAFMGQLDASIVTLAFPALERQFGTGLAGGLGTALGVAAVTLALHAAGPQRAEPAAGALLAAAALAATWAGSRRRP